MSELTVNNPELLDAYIDYTDKLQDISDYLELTNLLDNIRSPQLIGEDIITQDPKSLSIQRNLKKTLRSTTYLLLYNLIESTMTACIDAIYSTLKRLEIHHHAQQSTDYFIFHLRESIRKHVLKQYGSIFSNDGIAEISNNRLSVFNTIIDKGYDKKSLFNGNIDYALIREEAKKFGFNVRPLDPPNGLFDPEDILNIKTNRNILAHGAETFSECGNRLSIGEMSKKFTSTVNLLNAVFAAIDNYLISEAFYERA